jgi:hypothetical protein
VADLATEGGRIGKLISPVASHAAEDEKEGQKPDEQEKGPAVTGRIQVNSWQGGRFAGDPPPPFFYKHPNRNDQKAEDQNSGKDHIGENAEIRPCTDPEEIGQNEEEDAGEANQR